MIDICYMFICLQTAFTVLIFVVLYDVLAKFREQNRALSTLIKYLQDRGL